MSGGSGDDALVGDDGADSLSGGDGNDAFTGGAGNDNMQGEGGDDTLGLRDQLGVISLPRERGDDMVDGGSGNDTLLPGAGAVAGTTDADTLIGGAGIDRVDYGPRAASLLVSLDGAQNDGAPGEGDNVSASVEAVTSGSGDDTITGTAAPETFDGGEGDDVLSGLGGADTLVGSGGDDDLLGGADPDRLDGGEGEDYLEGGTGADTMLGGGASDTLATRDSAKDAVASCGARTDFAISDARDKLTSCDRFDDNTADGPVLGSKAALRPVQGDLDMRLPGTGRFVPLRDQADVPIGVRVDASGSKDKMRVTMAGGAGASTSKRRKRKTRRDRAVFSGGAFSVVQRRARRPVTDVRLLGGDFSVCKVQKTARGAVTAAAKRRDKIRKLLGQGKGHFRTDGRYSATTVRGTTWLVEDRCDGTLTSVRSGVVVVRDLVKRRNVVVRKGGSYLARAR